MSVNYSTTVANGRLQNVATALNTGGGGKLVIMTAAAASLVSVNLETTIGAPTNKVLTVIATPKQGTGSAAGQAATAKLTDSAGTTICDGLTVGTSAADVILNDLAIAVGSIVTINSGTITHP
jgi:hypothetical protein